MARFRLHPLLITLASSSVAVLMAFLLLLLTNTAPIASPALQAQTELPTPDGRVARPGAGSLGDPYYPWMGNTGYDALHYTIELTVSSPADFTIVMTGNVTLLAEATQPLSTFNLDFLGFEIEQITVNEAPASFSRLDRELVIIPAAPLPGGEPFTVTVAYAGTPLQVADPALPSFPGVGWLHLAGSFYALNQPSGASTWFPVNDYPQDKATYTYHITAPDLYTVAANGILVETFAHNGMTTYVWEANDPLASYLTTIVVAELEERTAVGPNGLPIRNYFPVDELAAITEPFETTSAQLEFFSELLGPYPFEVFGALVMDTNFPGALETQTMPVYGRSIVAILGERVLAHELAHQWIGNHVSVETWQDIWINEGFATYAEWLWVGETEGETAMNRLIQTQRSYSPPGRPSIDQLFGAGVYQRGGLTFAALHAQFGDEIFFRIMRTYIERYGGGTAGTDEFIAVAEEVSSEDLAEFFNAWLFDEEMPEIP